MRFVKDPSQKRGIFYLKTLLFLLVFSFLSFTISAQARIKFKENKKDLGTVMKGEVVSAEYEFTNEGDAPLLISDATFECSCTSVDFPKHPIAPGQSSKITVKFDTKNAYDRQDRKIMIVSNAKNSASVRIKCFVKKP
jgi:hypothetical protein